MRRFISPFTLICLLLLLSVIPALVTGQSTNVFAEAVGQANLRATPSTDAPLLGQIETGTRYPVIGRSEFFPWVLIADLSSQQPLGWVFLDLVTITGDIDSLPLSTLDVSSAPIAIPQSSAVNIPLGLPTATLRPGGAAGGQQDSSIPTATPDYNVSGIVIGEINIRYGPGIEYPRIAGALEGDRLDVAAYHTQFPWVQVRVPDSPNGYGWVANELLQFEGDPLTLPPVSQTTFNLPTLTPTAQAAQISSLPGQSPIPLSPAFQALGDQAWNMILEAGFQPELSRMGALYIQDLRTGEAITFGNNIAFSGTSINKIAILTELFAVLNSVPNPAEAVDIANTMICSENSATNRLLSLIGGGNALDGADRVTQFLQQLGLRNTFIAAPYDTTNALASATPAPRQPSIPASTADQSRANPDLVNQLTVDEMGWLLGSVYQCAVNNSGPLLERFPDQFTSQECQRIVDVMSNNTVDALLRAGAPAGTVVAHKHGWIEDTHSNAALFFTPGGDYVIVMVLYQPEFLNFLESLPLMAEVSRGVYNYYNPGTPLSAIRDGYIPDTETCDDYSPTLIDELSSPIYALPITPRPTLPRPTATSTPLPTTPSPTSEDAVTPTPTPLG
ncbi:MAG: serine hydrolase [Chitinophagaceae bacterium]|nr:serine hydrolase [Anaerolineae bacterium]